MLISFMTMTLFGCSTTKENFKLPDGNNASFVGNIKIMINGKPADNNCRVWFNGLDHNQKFKLDSTGDVYFNAEPGAIFIAKIACDGLWAENAQVFFPLAPTFINQEIKDLTYFGNIEIDWKTTTRIDLMDVLINRGPGLYGHGPLTLKVQDQADKVLVNFYQAHREAKALSLKKSLVKILDLSKN